MKGDTMELRPITTESPDLPRFDALNRQAFPEQERVPTEHLLAAEGLENFGIYEDGAFVGMLVMRVFRDLAYIAYFAIVPERRSQGLGSKALRVMREHYTGKQIVLDFEALDPAAENQPQRLRRREFYLRGGFYPTGWFQFYMETEFEIFCSEEDFDKTAFDAMLADIHAHVPEFDPHPYRKAQGESL